MLFAFQSYDAFAINMPFTHNIFIAKADTENDIAFTQYGKNLVRRKLSDVISHEITHTFIAKKTGLVDSYRIESWVEEGIADFVGSAPATYPYLNGLNVPTKENLTTNQKFYNDAYHLVTFLLINKGYTVDSLLNLEISLEDAQLEFQKNTR